MSEQHDRLVARGRRTRLTTSALTFVGGVLVVVGIVGHLAALVWVGAVIFVVACALTVLGTLSIARASRSIATQDAVRDPRS
ncbi:hypothetical protein [Luteimicrobium sp. DT211]|uniref:hypothetical protein n=1 Tax=Luteimicrobium sp. DT211 TaxID=3393412 RepID=UPI003CEF6F48